MTTIKIVSRYDASKILFQCDAPDSLASGMRIRHALGKAAKSNADLHDVDLSGANLSGADLSGAYFGSADLKLTRSYQTSPHRAATIRRAAGTIQRRTVASQRQGRIRGAG